MENLHRIGKYQYTERDGGILTIGIDDCMGDWGFIDMNFSEFIALSKSKQIELIKQSFI